MSRIEDGEGLSGATTTGRLKGRSACAIFSTAVLVTTLAAQAGAQTDLKGIADGIELRADASPYHLVGDLTVLCMTVEPGVRIVAVGDHEIRVTGKLTAVGAPADSITFTATDTIPGWQGLFLDQCFPSTELAYCRIERSTNSGLRVHNANPTVRNTRIVGNTARQGGGVRITSTAPFTMRNCVIEENGYTGSNPRGGGIHTEAPLLLDHCEIVRNEIVDERACGSSASTRGGGVYSTALLELDNVLLLDNLARSEGGAEDSRGGGVYATGGLIANRVVCVGNWASAGGCNIGGEARGYGGGIYATGSQEVALRNCIVARGYTRTHGGGVYLGSDGALVENCTIVFNAASTGTGGLHAQESATMVNAIEYFNFDWNDSLPTPMSGAVTATYSNVEGGWTGTGNLDVHPEVSNDSEALCTLAISPSSPMIDAGDPSSAFDDSCIPPSRGGSRNDIGAHGGPGACDFDFAGCNVVPLNVATTLPPGITVVGLSLSPNPTIGKTRIALALPGGTGSAKVAIYDASGRLVRALGHTAGNMSVHRLLWDGRDEHGRNVASGIYFVVATAGPLATSARVTVIR